MEKIIETPCGKIKGYNCRIPGVTAFKGIRFAVAERWKYPEEITGWEGIYDASSYGNCCFQPRSFYNEEENLKKVFYYNEFRKGETYNYSEDCLFLNIWAPDDADEKSRLPVLVYIHGGGYKGGCGHEKPFDDPIWPKKGVVAVTINYRLGPFGFACLPELEKEAGHCGNYGLYDQLTALKWINHNISAFGGNPEQVTIMGQSAGAMSVQHLCQSPLSEGLFRSAVMSSGGGAGHILTGKAEKNFDFWSEVMKLCGCKNLDEFRKVPAEKLFENWQKAQKEVKGGTMAATPVKDNIFITEKPEPLDIHYMMGSTSHDMMAPILYSMAKKWGIKNNLKNYVWFFERMLPGDKNGAWHSSDLWYWFGTLPNCWRPMEKEDYVLSEKMSEYLCNFVKNGNPNGGNLPEWKPCTKDNKKVLKLGKEKTGMGKANMAKLFYTMLTTKSVGE